MNSCDERIEKTLNRGGQTISDLPEPNESSFAYSGKLEEAYSAAMKFSKDEEAKEYGYTELMLSDYIMHLTDIIDRFEWALENVCNERDYLRTMARKEGCQTCIHHTYDNHLLCENEGKLCSLDDRGNCENYEYEGVPEDWSVDDE